MHVPNRHIGPLAAQLSTGVVPRISLLSILALVAGIDCVENPICGPHFPPLDPQTIDVGPPVIYPDTASLQPGQSKPFSIVRWECCWLPVEATATPCVQWSVEPAEAGTIDDNGNFQLSTEAQPGDKIIIKATFPDLVLTASVGVFTPESNPLVSLYSWVEKAALPCDPEEENIPGEFQELIFNADGTFKLTWYPFEIYVDYWGTYTYDPASGALSMQIVGGNFVPENTDLEGTVEVQDDGTIRLDSIYFGVPYSPDETTAEPTCGYIIQ